MPKVHDFNRSLALSKEHEDAPWWEEVYKKAFPDMVSMHSIKDKGWAQTGGIDRVITLASAKTLWIEEKVRSVDYSDILLEYFSSEERMVPGWIAKPLACDYIAYAIIPTKKCYLFPYQKLRSAWISYGEQWIKRGEKKELGFRIIRALNSNYTTVSVAVPLHILEWVFRQPISWK